jgi:cytidylate kinase
MASMSQKGRAAEGAERKPRVEVFPRIITVSREFGAGGSRIAGRVATELGFQLWDDELIAHVARRAQAEPELVREVDERERAVLDEVLATSLPFAIARGTPRSEAARLSGSKYRALLTRTVHELAARGAAVIVGRGANFLVDADQALRVRVVCPVKQRIDRHARDSQVDWARAETQVSEHDRARERFVRRLCGEQTTDPVHYDLVVNTCDLSDEAATRLIVAAYRARFGVVPRSARDDPREDKQELSATP